MSKSQKATHNGIAQLLTPLIAFFLTNSLILQDSFL